MVDDQSGIKHRLRSSNSLDESEKKAKDNTNEDDSESTTKKTDSPAPKLKKSTSEDFAKLISDMNPRWKNWWIRGIFTLILLGGFGVVIYLGPAALLLLIIVVQVKCYHEIISVGHQNYKKYNLPMFRTLSWYFLSTTNYFFYGEITAEYFAEMVYVELFRFLLQRHRLISFLLYTIGIMMFVLSLKKNYYKVQFALFGWYQLTLLIVLSPSHLTVQNMLTGLIWFFLPISMVICNDIFAYVFGFFFGRTRLIKLSPKKTWEGFIGGFFATVVYGLLVCELMCQYPYFYCPPQMDTQNTLKFTMECKPSPTFIQSHQFDVHPTILQVFQVLPSPLQNGITSILSLIGLHLVNNNQEIWMYPMIWHGIILACFSSLIAPFGGFFASGFKRAFKIKDFADTIPGHGGIMDRFDCQYLMGTFVNVYIASVIRAYNPSKLLQQVMFMEKDHQVQFYQKLQDSLRSQGLL